MAGTDGLLIAERSYSDDESKLSVGLAYVREAVSEKHTDWIERELQPLIGGDLEAIVLNNLTAGEHGAEFWGGSSIWAPSGMCLIQGSHVNEELVIVHNVDIEGATEPEKDDFDYGFDFQQIYRPMESGRTFTRDVS